jgi:hypothetical protein
MREKQPKAMENRFGGRNELEARQNEDENRYIM